MSNSSIYLKLAFYNEQKVISGYVTTEFIPADFLHMKASKTSAGVFLYSKNLPFVRIVDQQVPEFYAWLSKFTDPTIEKWAKVFQEELKND